MEWSLGWEEGRRGQRGQGRKAAGQGCPGQKGKLDGQARPGGFQPVPLSGMRTVMNVHRGPAVCPA